MCPGVTLLFTCTTFTAAQQQGDPEHGPDGSATAATDGAASDCTSRWRGLTPAIVTTGFDRPNLILKAERKQGKLRVLSAQEERGADRVRVAEALADELLLLARWVGLQEVAVSDRGGLAGPLRSALKKAQRRGSFGVEERLHLEDA